jgi:hypothetical protein
MRIENNRRRIELANLLCFVPAGKMLSVPSFNIPIGPSIRFTKARFRSRFGFIAVSVQHFSYRKRVTPSPGATSRSTWSAHFVNSASFRSSA